MAWKGELDLYKYGINHDTNPQVIQKKHRQVVNYIQELMVRYLKPPTPPAPGDILIYEEANIVTGPAPPLIIRQQPPRAPTPEPLVFREIPPEPPAPVKPRRIVIKGECVHFIIIFIYFKFAPRRWWLFSLKKEYKKVKVKLKNEVIVKYLSFCD